MTNKVKYVHTEETHNLNASNQVVPILIKLFNPKSVLDVGCGIGTWLNTFNKLGVKEIFGLDGDYVNRDVLARYINVKDFSAIDLAYPFNLNKQFDLVISLEVAEHLPETAAQDFVDSLCKHSDTIIFSAAIPNQGGQNHLNEQWKQYWINMFAKYQFNPYDLLRPKIWNIKEVEYWYKQNMLVFSKLDLAHLISYDKTILETIHPEMLMEKLDWYSAYVKGLHEQITDLEKKGS